MNFFYLEDEISDYTFTSSNLENNKLIVSGVSLGGFVVEDNGGNIVYPDMKAISENQVEVDFTGWTITGTWIVRFARGKQGIQGIPGLDSISLDDAIKIAILLG